MTEAFGERLRAARREAGLSLRALAGAVHYDVGHLSKIENGARTPSVELAAACDGVLGTARELAELAADARRLSQTRFSPTNLPLALDQRADIAGIKAVATAFSTADRQVGGARLYPAVHAYLRTCVAPQLVDAPTGRTIFAAAASLTEIVAWMAHDGGDNGRARQHFGHAYDLARAADDDLLTANVCSGLAHLAVQVGRPADAVRIADRGLDRMTRQVNRQLEARLQVLRAHGLARQGAVSQAHAAIEAVEDALAQAANGEPGEWVAPFDEGSLRAETAEVLARTGDLGAAEADARRVLQLRNGDRVRSRAFGQLRLARILLEDDRPDEAAETASEVCAVAPSLTSARVQTQLDALGTFLSPWHANAAVASFLDRLATLRAADHDDPRDTDWPV